MTFQENRLSVTRFHFQGSDRDTRLPFHGRPNNQRLVEGSPTVTSDSRRIRLQGSQPANTDIRHPSQALTFLASNLIPAGLLRASPSLPDMGGPQRVQIKLKRSVLCELAQRFIQQQFNLFGFYSVFHVPKPPFPVLPLPREQTSNPLCRSPDPRISSLAAQTQFRSITSGLIPRIED